MDQDDHTIFLTGSSFYYYEVQSQITRNRTVLFVHHQLLNTSPFISTQDANKLVAFTEETESVTSGSTKHVQSKANLSVSRMSKCALLISLQEEDEKLRMTLKV